jgi:hypothetical protein
VKKEEGRRKKEKGRGKEEGRGKKEEGNFPRLQSPVSSSH